MVLKLTINFILICAISTPLWGSSFAGAGVGALAEDRPRAAIASSEVTSEDLGYHYNLYGLSTAAEAFKTKLNQLEREHLVVGASDLPAVAILRIFLGEWMMSYGLATELSPAFGTSLIGEPKYERIAYLKDKKVLKMEKDPASSALTTTTSNLFNGVRFPYFISGEIEGVGFSSVSAAGRSMRHPIIGFYEAMERWVLDEHNPFALLLYGTMVYDGIGCSPDQARALRNIGQAKERQVIPALEFIGLHLHAQIEEARRETRDAREAQEAYQTMRSLYQKLLKPAMTYEQIITKREPDKSIGRADRIRDNLLLEVYVTPHREALLTFCTELESAVLKGSASLRPHPKSEEITISLANSLVPAALGGLQIYNSSIVGALSALGGIAVTGGLGVYSYVRGGEGILWFVECCRRSRCRKPLGISSLEKDVFEDKVHEVALHQTLRFADDISKMSGEGLKTAAQSLSAVILGTMTSFNVTKGSLSAFVVDTSQIKEARFI